MSIHPFFGIQDHPDATFLVVTKNDDPTYGATIEDVPAVIEVQSLEEAEDLFVARMLEHATPSAAGWSAFGLASTSLSLAQSPRRTPATKLVVPEVDWERVEQGLIGDPDTRYQALDPQHGVGRSMLRGTAQNHNLRVYSSEALPPGRMLMLFQSGQIDGPAVFSNPDRFYLTYNPGSTCKPEDYVKIILIST